MCAWNVVVVAGRLSRPAEQRLLPSGERLVAVQLTVDRPADRAETVPVVWFDAPASAATLDVEETVVVVGRVRRRFFRTGGSTQSRTEVVADTVVPVRRAKQASGAVTRALAQLQDAASELDGLAKEPSWSPARRARREGASRPQTSAGRPG